jgi:hypothetical protein
MPVARIERVFVSDREDIFTVIVEHDAALVVGRNRPDERFRQLAGGRSSAEPAVVLLPDDEGELQGIGRKVWFLGVRCSVRIGSDRYGIRRALSCTNEHRDALSVGDPGDCRHRRNGENAQSSHGDCSFQVMSCPRSEARARPAARQWRSPSVHAKGQRMAQSRAVSAPAANCHGDLMAPSPAGSARSRPVFCCWLSES